MQRLLLFIILLTSIYSTAQIQTELNVAIPTGDTADFIKIGGDFKVNYMYPITDEFKVGPSLGLSLFLEESSEDLGIGVSEEDGFFFLPLTVRGEYTFLEMFVTGLHLGYALYLGESGEGGFYYRPSIGYLITEKLTLQASYNGVSQDGGAFSYFGLGISFFK